MKRVMTGRYETSRVGGETVRAFVPRPLPPEPPRVLGACVRSSSNEPSLPWGV